MIDNLMWTVTILAIFGFFLNMQKNKWGYIVWLITNVAFFVYSIHLESYSQAGLWLFYSGFCIYGFIKWSSDKYRGCELVVLTQDGIEGFNKGDICIILPFDPTRHMEGRIVLKHYKKKIKSPFNEWSGTKSKMEKKIERIGVVK